MKKRLVGFLLAAMLCVGVSQVLAQSTADTDAGLQPLEVVVDSKMVKAVQTALISRGYYRARPNGVLDAETREGLRSFQSSAGLNASGHIDNETLQALGVDAKNPVVASERRNGFVPKIGYGVKDGAVKSKDTVVGGAKYVGRTTRKGYDKTVSGTKTGLNKTKDVSVGAFRKSKDVTVGAGQSANSKMREAGSKTGNVMQRTSTAIVGRSDTDIHLDVRDILDDETETNQFTSSVSRGTVTLKLPQGFQGDVSPTITSIRKVPGVKSVIVVQL